MNKKHIYLHMGTPKTGTTTIQGFMIHNREIFRRNNFSVYTPERTNDSNAPARLRSLVDYMQVAMSNKTVHLDPDQQQWLNNLIELIKNDGTDNVILSEELFWHTIGPLEKQAIFSDFIKQLKEFADISVIVYLRRQDLYLMSKYQQVLKVGRFPMKGRICKKWLDQIAKSDYKHEDFKRVFKSGLIPLFGKENIIIRPFEKDQFVDQSLINDFMKCIGMQMSDAFKIPDELRNQGLSPFIAEVIRCLSKNGSDKNLIVPLMRSKNSNNAKFYARDCQHKFLSPEDRISIVRHYDADNAWIAREFLGRQDGKLFMEPLPDVNEPWEKYQLKAAEVKEFLCNADNLNKAQKLFYEKRLLAAIDAESSFIGKIKSIIKGKDKSVFPVGSKKKTRQNKSKKRKKQIYLHIGIPKTGTTSIQYLLRKNKKILKQNNFSAYTPKGIKGKKSATRLRKFSKYMQEAIKSKTKSLNASQQEWVDNLIDSIRSQDSDNVILSEELLWKAFMNRIKREIIIDFIDKLREFADIKVIVYLRRQDSYFMSKYQNASKGGKIQGQVCEDWINEYLDKEQDTCDYKSNLKQLTAIFGKKNIVVRLFEKKQFYGESLLADFSHSVDLPLSEDCVKNSAFKNPGISPFLSEIIRLLSIDCKDRATVTSFVCPESKMNKKLFNFDQQHDFLSPKARIKLLQRYKKINKWVARKFLGFKDGVLFREALPDINAPWQEYQLKAEEVNTFFDEATFLNDDQRTLCREKVLNALK